jgi:hypothetical protein
MKLVFALLAVLSGITLPYSALAQPYQCVSASGRVLEINFPCDPVTIDKFGARFAELYPGARQEEKSSPEYMKNAYVMAIAACEGRLMGMTPEQIGKSSEPFLPWQVTAAMVQAARKTVCSERK